MFQSFLVGSFGRCVGLTFMGKRRAKNKSMHMYTKRHEYDENCYRITDLATHLDSVSGNQPLVKKTHSLDH